MIMRSYDESVETNHNPFWPYIPDLHYRILIIGSLGSGKTDVLINLIKHQRPDVEKVYLVSKFHSIESINYLLIEEKK